MVAAISEPTRLAPMDDAEMQAHLKLASLEKTSSDEDIAALKGASDCVVTVLSAVQLMLDEPQAMPPENIRRTIEVRLLEVASIFAAGGYAAKVGPVSVDDACTDLAISAVAFLNAGAHTVRRLETSPEFREAKGERRILLARCIHKSRAYAVCVQGHGRRYAELSPLFHP